MSLSTFKTPVSTNKEPSLVLKKDLTEYITMVIRQRGWSGVQAANYLGVNPTRISYIFNNHIHKFTIDFLVNILSRLDFQIESGGMENYSIDIKPPKSPLHFN